MSDNGTKSKQTLVEDGTTLKGTMASYCPVVVRGSIEGELHAPAVTVTATGTVSGHLRTKQLHSQGVIAGEVDAESVVLAGSVRDDTVLRASSIEVKLESEGGIGATFGACQLEVGDPEAHEPRPVEGRQSCRPRATTAESVPPPGAE